MIHTLRLTAQYNNILARRGLSLRVAISHEATFTAQNRSRERLRQRHNRVAMSRTTLRSVPDRYADAQRNQPHHDMARKLASVSFWSVHRIMTSMLYPYRSGRAKLHRMHWSTPRT